VAFTIWTHDAAGSRSAACLRGSLHKTNTATARALRHNLIVPLSRDAAALPPGYYRWLMKVISEHSAFVLIDTMLRLFGCAHLYYAAFTLCNAYIAAVTPHCAPRLCRATARICSLPVLLFSGDYNACPSHRLYNHSLAVTPAFLARAVADMGKCRAQASSL